MINFEQHFLIKLVFIKYSRYIYFLKPQKLQNARTQASKYKFKKLFSKDTKQSLQSRAGFPGAGGHLLKQINEYDAAINQTMKKISYVIDFNRADDARPNYKVCNVSNAKNMKYRQ